MIASFPGTSGLTRRSALRVIGAAAAGAGIAITPACAGTPRLPELAPWVVYYGITADLAEFAPYRVVVLDPAFEPSIQPLIEAGVTLLGYVSVGEASARNRYFERLKQGGVLLQENRHWPGSYAIDLRQELWSQILLEEVIPEVLAKGYQGLFLDTLDTAGYNEGMFPQRFAGMRQAAVSLVESMRDRFTMAPLMMNRGYAILPELVDSIDAVVAESLVTTYDFASKSYRWVAPNIVAQQVAMLRPAWKGRRQLPIYALDYWDTNDTKTVREIYRRERAMNHSPYVAGILLDAVTPEPVR